MKSAAYFRQAARDALRGKWPIAVIAGLIATLLGGTDSNGLKVNFDFSSLNVNLQVAGQNIVSWGSNKGGHHFSHTHLLGGMTYILIALIALAVILFVLGSVVSVGYSRFNLNLLNGETLSIDTLFSYLPYWKTTVAAKFIRGVYTFCWALLFIIPGIMAAYSYAMTDFILAEYPDLDPTEAIRRSKAMMDGKRWELFYLELTFLGWSILASLTLGIGSLFLIPYKKAAAAAFYRELTAPAVLPEL